MTIKNTPLRTGHSLNRDPVQAVRELHRAIAQPEMALVIFFCSSHFDLGLVAAEFNALFPQTQVIGCTTAGEFGPAGYCVGSLVGVSFAAGSSSVIVQRIAGLKNIDESAVRDQVWMLRQQLAEQAGKHFALLLIDGLCGREESIAHACQAVLGNMPLVGGSAGDDQHFIATRIFVDGAFHDDSAVLAMLTTELPFKLFRSHHFTGAAEPLVVTEADASRRIVYEINGRPAAQEYARAAGIDAAQLTAAQFAAAPLVVRINGNDYVRSIRQLNADGSLTLYCAIERGVILHIAKSLDLLETRRALFDELQQSIRSTRLILGFNCIHCALEAQGKDQQSAIERLFQAHQVLGFSSYGEQFMGIHVNQTFTGIAIGEAEGAAHE